LCPNPRLNVKHVWFLKCLFPHRRRTGKSAQMFGDRQDFMERTRNPFGDEEHLSGRIDVVGYGSGTKLVYSNEVPTVLERTMFSDQVNSYATLVAICLVGSIAQGIVLPRGDLLGELLVYLSRYGTICVIDGSTLIATFAARHFFTCSDAHSPHSVCS
jgi:hypothetical protein